MACLKCRSLQLDAENYIHQSTCPDYEDLKSRNDADVMRLRLNGVELGMHADTVLTIHPIDTQAKKPVKVGVDGVDDRFGKPRYVVKWIYPGFTLTLEQAEREHEEYGLISVYAVQSIEENNERKRSKSRKSRYGIPRSASKHRRNPSHRRGKLK